MTDQKLALSWSHICIRSTDFCTFLHQWTLTFFRYVSYLNKISTYDDHAPSTFKMVSTRVFVDREILFNYLLIFNFLWILTYLIILLCHSYLVMHFNWQSFRKHIYTFEWQIIICLNESLPKHHTLWKSAYVKLLTNYHKHIYLNFFDSAIVNADITMTVTFISSIKRKEQSIRF